MDTKPSQPNPYYTAVLPFLQQGDIFRLEVVTPNVDTEKRIFRTADGRHGSAVFSEHADANVFEIDELQEYLNGCSRGALHTDPFSPTDDGHDEMVVVQSKLRSYFIIASQTCDVCGQDKSALPAAIILPLVTIRDMCKTTKLPMGEKGEEMTIEEFLITVTDGSALKSEKDDFNYPTVLRAVLGNWQPVTSSLKEKKGRIKNFLIKNTDWMHWLKHDPEFRVPECYVDFSVAHSVPTIKLTALKQNRLTQLAEPHRTNFAHSFANRLARIAVPVPMKPQTF